jgi:peptide/nickel transport system substrate-binding protein
MTIMLACQPAPTAPAVPAAPAKPAEQPTAAPAAKPAEQPATAPAAKPAEQPAVAAKPAESPAAKPTAPSGRLVVAVPQWGIETPLAWRSASADKALWDVAFDSLIMRDPKTAEYRPGLATSWDHSADNKTWTFKLRQGVMFHENFGEMTADDVKFTIEQNLKPDSQGGSAPFFRDQLAGIETPDKYTVVMRFKNPVWEVPGHLAQRTGYQNIISKKYVEQVGEEKAGLHPIGTGPYHHVEGKQGDFHRFEAVPNHWRVTPAYQELIIRRVADPAARVAGLRSGEIDVAQVMGDYLDQTKKAGLNIHEVPSSAQYWIVLSGQTSSNYDDYCPQCPWVGDPNDPKSLEKAQKVRLALNLAVNKQAIVDGLWRGYGALTPFSYMYYPTDKGYSADWKIPPYDPQRAKQLLAEAGYPNGFEIRANPTVQNVAVDGPDVVEAVALDWEKVGLQVKRLPEDFGAFLSKVRARKTNMTAWPYGSLPQDEPILSLSRAIWTKGPFNLLAEGPFDQDVDTILRETDANKRAQLTHDLGQKLYDQYRGVMIGMRATTWGVSKKVGNWPTIAYTPTETNIEYITPGQ